MDSVSHENAPKIQLETVAAIQDLLLSMDLKLAEASKSRPRYDRKTELRIERSVRALKVIRKEIERTFDG